MAARTELAALAAALAACTRPADVAVICHNGNCAGAHDIAADDTMAALDASLALVGGDGAPITDGIEFDLSWVAAESRCVFAHDLVTQTAWPDAAMPAAHVAAHIASGAPLSRHGDGYTVMIELKRAVDGNGTLGTPSQRASLAACGVAALTTIRDAAVARGVAIGFLMESFEPNLLAALVADPGWPGQARTGDVQLRLSGAFYLPPPIGYTHALSDFAAVTLDVVDVHPRLTSTRDYSVYDSLDVDVSLWVDDVTTELFGTIERVQPAFVDTSEPALVSGWLDDRI